MFTKFLSSMGWLACSPERAGNGLSLESDRRVWVRYPCSARVNCQPAGAADSETLPARVTNVSRGGMGLLVDRPFEPGRFLSVELPAPAGEGVSRVLACVLHATPQPGGRWAVGCSFSAELTDDDLQAFGARRVKPETSADQRSWVRFPCPVQALYQQVRDGEPAQRPGRVVDISPSGIGLLVSRAEEVGTLLGVEMRGAGTATPLTMLAAVVRVTARPDGDWTLGCSFIRELSEQELQALL